MHTQCKVDGKHCVGQERYRDEVAQLLWDVRGQLGSIVKQGTPGCSSRSGNDRLQFNNSPFVSVSCQQKSVSW